jgi:hypothetical protein
MNPNSFENGVGDQSNWNHIPMSAPVPDRDSIFTTRIKLSNNIRMRSSFFYSKINHITKMKDAISSPCSIFLEICTAFLNFLDEIRLADIKFERFQQVFQFSKLPENVHLPKVSCVERMDKCC